VKLALFAGSAGIFARLERAGANRLSFMLKVELKRKSGSLLSHALAGRDARAPGKKR
jgi:hypothetical protein